MVPGPFNPQSLNRYSYTLNNPVNYIDPSGFYYIDRNRNTIYESEDQIRKKFLEYRGVDINGNNWAIAGNPVWGRIPLEPIGYTVDIVGYDYSWFYAPGVREQIIAELYPPPAPTPTPTPAPTPSRPAPRPQPPAPVPAPAPLPDPVPEVDIKPTMNYWLGVPMVTPYGTGMITMPISMPVSGFFAKGGEEKEKKTRKETI